MKCKWVVMNMTSAKINSYHETKYEATQEAIKTARTNLTCEYGIAQVVGLTIIGEIMIKEVL